MGQKCLILTNVKNNRKRPICILQDPNSHEPNLKIESDRKSLYKKKKEKEKNKFSIKICKIKSSIFKIKFTFLYNKKKKKITLIKKITPKAKTVKIDKNYS